MTIDPMFHFDESIPQQVQRTHTAELVERCVGLSVFGSERTLVLPDGTSIDLPTEQELSDLGLDEQAWLDQLQEPAAVRIEQFTPTASGAELVFDGTLR